nr:MAG TPA: hypothetical protein [Caudoviricetes sp.]
MLCFCCLISAAYKYPPAETSDVRSDYANCAVCAKTL